MFTYVIIVLESLVNLVSLKSRKGPTILFPGVFVTLCSREGRLMFP